MRDVVVLIVESLVSVISPILVMTSIFCWLKGYPMTYVIGFCLFGIAIISPFLVWRIARMGQEDQ